MSTGTVLHKAHITHKIGTTISCFAGVICSYGTADLNPLIEQLCMDDKIADLILELTYLDL